MRQALSEWCSKRGNSTLIQQWDSEKNGVLTPETVSYGSKKKLWWRCQKGHTWQAAVYARTNGAGCPYCAGKRVQSGSNDLETLYPQLIPEWNTAKNIGLPPPSEISPWSHRKVWWRCHKGHEWEASVKSRTEGCGCPACVNRVAVSGQNDLATMYPSLAMEWDFEKNGTVLPQDVLAGSHRRVYWRCAKGHVWRAPVSSRTVMGYGCPYCAGKRVQSGVNDLASALPHIAQEWDFEKNDSLAPTAVTPQSNRKVWWRCPLGHSYEASVIARTAKNTGCPYCAGRRVLPGFNDLATKEPVVAAQWHPSLNGALTAEMVTPGSSKKVWWQCPLGHVWKAVISSRATGRKSGCPVCAGVTRRHS